MTELERNTIKNALHLAWQYQRDENGGFYVGGYSALLSLATSLNLNPDIWVEEWEQEAQRQGA